MSVCACLLFVYTIVSEVVDVCACVHACSCQFRVYCCVFDSCFSANIRVYTYMCVLVCERVFIHTHTSSTLRVAYVSSCICFCVYVSVYVFLCACVNAHMCLCVFCVCVCVYVHLQLCVCVCAVDRTKTRKNYLQVTHVKQVSRCN